MNTKTNKTNGITFTRPALVLQHANAKGTGCAIRLELHPAEVDEDGYILMALAPQKTVGNMTGGKRVGATFDWENRIEERLGFRDISQIMQVFRGECESIAYYRGLYFTGAQGPTRVLLRHIVDPVSGYSLEVYRTSADRGDERRAHFLMDPAEALGLCETFAQSLMLVALGVPRLVTIA